MQSIAILEVGMDGERRIFVRPDHGDFEQIYRAAMEVYWDQSAKSLSHPHPPREWSSAKWFRQIVEAVADEYRVRLNLTNNTLWTNVPVEVRSEIEAIERENGS